MTREGGFVFCSHLPLSFKLILLLYISSTPSYKYRLADTQVFASYDSFKNFSKSAVKPLKLRPCQSLKVFWSTVFTSLAEASFLEF